MTIEKPISFHSWKFPDSFIWDGIFPMVRRIHAQLIGLDLVPVQPLGPPLALLDAPYYPEIFYRKEKWEPNKPKSWQHWVIQKKWEKTGLLDGLHPPILSDNEFRRGIPGYIYAPYMPVMITPPIVEEDFAPARQIASRYARRMVNNNFYTSIGEFNIANRPE